MSYDEAMALIRRTTRPIVGRAGLRVGWRFGRAVMLTGAGRWIDFAPTREDMHARDWEVVDTAP